MTIAEIWDPTNNQMFLFNVIVPYITLSFGLNECLMTEWIVYLSHASHHAQFLMI